jgi:transposase
LLDDFIDTSRYVSNKAIEQIEKGHKPHFPSLRDLLVTSNTKKNSNIYIKLSEEIMALHAVKHNTEDPDEKQAIVEEIKTMNKILKGQMKLVAFQKNQNVQEFENLTPKEIRANAVQSVCDAYKSAFTNLKNGNIKFFKMKYRQKKSPRQTIELAPSCISFNNGVLKILPRTFKDDCILKISNKNKKKYNNLTIENNVDIVRQNGNYFAHILKTVEKKEKEKKGYTICGIDPGVRTFCTTYSFALVANETTPNICIRDYEHRIDLLKKLNKKKDQIMASRAVRKKQYNKIEKKKKNVVDCLHWNTINHVLQNNDIVFYGDIKSQDITKGNKNKVLNRDFNDLKFHMFKTRLIYKASVLNKKIVLMNECYTTKTCSGCGTLNNDIGSKKTFTCSHCKLVTGRDLNASKNILMKGLLS